MHSTHRAISRRKRDLLLNAGASIPPEPMKHSPCFRTTCYKSIGKNFRKTFSPQKFLLSAKISDDILDY